MVAACPERDLAKVLEDVQHRRPRRAITDTRARGECAPFGLAALSIQPIRLSETADLERECNFAEPGPATRRRDASSRSNATVTGRYGSGAPVVAERGSAPCMAPESDGAGLRKPWRLCFTTSDACAGMDASSMLLCRSGWGDRTGKDCGLGYCGDRWVRVVAAGAAWSTGVRASWRRRRSRSRRRRTGSSLPGPMRTCRTCSAWASTGWRGRWLRRVRRRSCAPRRRSR